MRNYTDVALLGLSDDEWVAIINDEIAREDWTEWLFAPVEVDDRQLELFDYDAETDDLVEARLDEEFWRGGC